MCHHTPHVTAWHWLRGYLCLRGGCADIFVFLILFIAEFDPESINMRLALRTVLACRPGITVPPGVPVNTAGTWCPGEGRPAVASSILVIIGIVVVFFVFMMEMWLRWSLWLSSGSDPDDRHAGHHTSCLLDGVPHYTSFSLTYLIHMSLFWAESEHSSLPADQCSPHDTSRYLNLFHETL